MENSTPYTVTEVIQETRDVATLVLRSEENISSYRAGQFITVYFPETGHAEGKSYSISKCIDEHHISITVKDIGVFSHRLVAMKVGDIVHASLPYGYFYSESATSSLVLVAGGIGVAPFRGMIYESLHNNPSRPVMLFYSSKKAEDIIFRNEFDALAKKFPKAFSVKYYVTQEKVSKPLMDRRIPVIDIAQESIHLSDREFLLCGSISFVRDFWRGLKEEGVPEETIYTEAFF